VLNVSIPLELGELINTVTKLEVGKEVKDYLRQLAPSAIRLLALYSLQVRIELRMYQSTLACATIVTDRWVHCSNQNRLL